MISRSKLTAALGYIRNGISPVQALLKHSLIPADMLERHLPKEGVILDCGCGEGMFANFVARQSAKRQVIGMDLDAARIEIARRNAAPNATFNVGDMFNLPPDLRVDAVILNDVVHHTTYDRHSELMTLLCQRLRPGGVIVLKEVDQADRMDKAWTSLFDSKLYPKDRLCFRTVDEWRALSKRLGLRDMQVKRVRHPWPASRTVLFLHRPPDAELFPYNRPVPAGSGDSVDVFITGATGFIGGHVARHLLRHGLRGQKVRLLLLTRDPERVPEDLRGPAVVPIVGELDDLPRLKDALRGVRYVFHLAAEVKFFGGADLWRHNHEGVLSVLKAVADVPLQRFIHASTMGAVDRTPADPCTRPLDESDPPHPLSDYGRSKLAAEEAVRQSGKAHTIVRIPWGYGSGMTPDTHVRKLTQTVHDGKCFTWFDFPGRVSIMAVADLARAIVFLAEKEEAANQTIFVTDGKPVPLGRLLTMMGDMVGRRAGFISVPRWMSAIARKLRPWLPLPAQNLNSDVLCASNERLLKLGFTPTVSQREGLHRLAESIGLFKGQLKPGMELASVVTGAASGIGRALSEQLTAQGHRLILVDKDSGKLDQLARSLRAEALCLDLTQPDAAGKLETYLVEKNYQLDWVINNAGIGVRGNLAEVPLERLQAMVAVNCTALTAISRLALRHFLDAKRGTLVNIASSSAFQPLPGMSAYAASKSYVLSLSRGITGEVRDLPQVRVLTVSPSGTDTGFQAAAGVKKNPNERLLSAEEVAAQIICAAQAGREEIIIGRSGRAMACLGRLLPARWQISLWRHLMQGMR
jgi:short-subunit dehydrogenase/SAM-dependent methyltransferase